MKYTSLPILGSLCLLIMLLMANHISAQKIIREKDKTTFYSADKCVYRIKGFDQLFERFEKKKIADGGGTLFMASKDTDGWKLWCDQLLLRVTPKELIPWIDSLQVPEPGRVRGWHSYSPSDDDYYGLIIKIYFDREGNIFTAEFYVGQKLREITKKYLKEIYNSLLKEKAPDGILQALGSVKDFREWNSECFSAELHFENKKKMNQ